MKSNETLIAVRDLISKKGTRSDGVKYSFEDINFNLKQGEILIIVGERGAGKTSLARSIIGLEKVSGGSVDFDDKLVIGGVPNFYLAGLKLMKDLKKIDRLITLSRRVAFEFLYGVKSQYFKYTKNMKYNKSTNEVTGYYDANYLDIDFNKDNIMDIIGTSTWRYIGMYRNTHVQIMELVSEAVISLIRQEHLLNRLYSTNNQELIDRQAVYRKKIESLIDDYKFLKKSIRWIYDETYEVGKVRERIHEVFKTPKDYYIWVLDVIDNVLKIHNQCIERMPKIFDYTMQIVSSASPISKRKKYIKHYNELINLPRTIIKDDYISYRRKMVEWKFVNDKKFKKENLEFLNHEIQNLWHKGLINFSSIKRYLKVLQKKLLNKINDADEQLAQLIAKLGDNNIEKDFKKFHNEKVLTNVATLDDIVDWEAKLKYILKVIKKNVISDRKLIDKWHEFKEVPYKFSREKVEEYEVHLRLLESKSINEILKSNQSFNQATNDIAHILKRDIQYIFRNPISVMNEKMTIEQILNEAIDGFPELFRDASVKQEYADWYNKGDQQGFFTRLTVEKVRDTEVKRYLITKVLHDVEMPATTITKYPRELSPGQLQKISLARALLLRPKVLIIDEPTSTLDATFRVIYMDLIKKISSSLNISILVVDNDIKFSKQYADRIAVMESGHIVEIATVDEILNRPLHDYTKKLVESLPIMKMHYKREDMIPYEKDSYIDYLLDIPITFEVFPGHFASMRDREMNAILKEYKGAKDLLSEVLK